MMRVKHIREQACKFEIAFLASVMRGPRFFAWGNLCIVTQWWRSGKVSQVRISLQREWIPVTYLRQ